MNNMIGKSGCNWEEAPITATHKFIGRDDYYKKVLGTWCHYNRTEFTWQVSTNTTDLSIQHYCLSKEEDLRVDKKEVKSVSDLGIGIFIRWESSAAPYVFIDEDTLLSFSTGDKFFRNSSFTDTSLAKAKWSYTYSGEYTLIIKETEAERKIKELEATIELAQKQLQEYKGMK